MALCTPWVGPPCPLSPTSGGHFVVALWGSPGPGWVQGGDWGGPTWARSGHWEGAAGGAGWGGDRTRVIPGFPQVEVEVESMDKAGNFIGWLHIEGVNLSVALVEQALSRVHFTAERSPYCKALLAAQDAAKQRKEKVRGLRGPAPPAVSPPQRQGPVPKDGPTTWDVPTLRDVPTKGCPRVTPRGVSTLRDDPTLRGVPMPRDVPTPRTDGHTRGNVTTPNNVPTHWAPAHQELPPPRWMSPSQEMFRPKECPHSWRVPHPKG